MGRNGSPDSELVVSIEASPHPGPSTDEPIYEVVVSGEGGDYSWAAYMDPSVAKLDQSRLVTMMAIVLPPGIATVRSEPLIPDPENE
jgi:hypothetical protein